MHETRTEDEFEIHRGYLRGYAYRMIGSLVEADDVVQEAWLRWRAAKRDNLGQPRAFLAQIVTNLCLDHLKSARVRRESYVGPWLPEPIVEEQGLVQAGADAATELASELSYAFLFALERLSPLERAAFLLHDVFDEDFSAIAITLGRTEAACRQLAARARTRVREAKPRFAVSQAESERVATAFMWALHTGDVDALKNLLAEDAKLISDGGGRVAAAGLPIHGRERIVKFLVGVRKKIPPPPDAGFQFARINGLWGVVVRQADGTPLQTTALEVTPQGKVSAIYAVRNPDKLKYL